MNLASSSSSNVSSSESENNLAKLFGSNFVQSTEDINEPNGTLFSDGNSSSQSSASSSSSSFGQNSSNSQENNVEDSMETDEVKGEGQTTDDGLDLSKLALQLLQHAQAQGILFQQQKEENNDNDDGNEKIQSNDQFEQSKTSLNPSPQPTVTPTKSSKSGGNRRSGSKSLISAATAAALMAPSPLGQLPSIPGAIAVAVSPAAQLFNGDDWSWHRNPAAAIRSGGTNKQTPVWKYFVYNKAENLSRCIVGNCTYQLKGPHTSTLACHLKKHSHEYAEFQRLKSEYTRERIAAGHGQAGRLDENTEGSGCSTPTNGSNGNGMVGPCTQVTSPNGTIIRAQSPKEAKKGSRMFKNNDANVHSRSTSLSCASSPGPTNPIFVGQSADFHQNGGIFGGTNGSAIPPPPSTSSIGNFHHFMLAAVLATAAQNGGQQQMGGHCRPNSLELFGTPLRNGQNGFHHPLGQTMLTENGKAEMNGGGGINLPHGPGSNLLDILNLLSKKAANHSFLFKKEEDEREDDQEDQPHQNQKMEPEETENEQQQNGKKEEDDGMMQRRKGGGRKRTMANQTEEDQPKRRPSGGGGGGGLAAHSVEHLLCGTSATVTKEEEQGKEEAILAVPSIKSIEAAEDYRKLALSFGTGLPRAELEQFLATNPFIRAFDHQLTVDSIEETLQNEFDMLKERIANELRGTDSANLILMAEFCCSNCWNMPLGEDGKCLTKGCENVDQFWCTISTEFRRSNDHRMRTILLAVRKMEATRNDELLTEGLTKLISSLNLSTLLGISHTQPNILIRPQQFSNMAKMGEMPLANLNDGNLPSGLGLAKIFGKNAGNWAKEEEVERIERVALLLCNWQLILDKEERQQIDGNVRLSDYVDLHSLIIN